MEREKMETLSYKLEVFEGPLDLLLTLIAKNKLNIYDIPITLLLEQYMEQIERMQSENLDIASEFLEMAARLVHIKSVSLLPKREEEEALRRELTGQLLEYQQCRETAEKLRAMVSFDRLVRPQSKIPADHAYKRHHAPEEMLAAYLSAMGRKRPRRFPVSWQSRSSRSRRRSSSCCAVCGSAAACRSASCSAASAIPRSASRRSSRCLSSSRAGACAWRATGTTVRSD